MLMQLKTLQRPMLATLLATALLFSCSDKEKKTETEVKAVDTMVPVPTPPPDSMDTGVVKPVVPTAPK